jgi:hypothetical protein
MIRENKTKKKRKRKEMFFRRDKIDETISTYKTNAKRKRETKVHG